MKKDLLAKVRAKEEQENLEKGWDELKSQMMYFIATASNVVMRIEEIEKGLAYLLSKDPEWMAANKELLEEAEKAQETQDAQEASQTSSPLN